MPKNSKRTWRIILGVLVAANIAALAMALYPPGGSAEDLGQQLTSLQAQASAARVRLNETRKHVEAVEKGRSQGDEFLSSYFLSRRTAYSTLLTELVSAADESRVTPKEHAYVTEPIDGSDTLSMMTITANYEGTYQNLMRFIHRLDQSSRLLIIEGLNAAPLQNSGTLSVNMKIDTFVRDDAEIPVTTGAPAAVLIPNEPSPASPLVARKEAPLP